MPIIKSAIKKLHQAKVRTERNRQTKRVLKKIADEFKKNPSAKLFSKLSSALDKTAKNNVIHQNKAARLKSRLSRLLPRTPAPKRTK